MRPLDPRLVRQARATRPFLVATTVLSIANVGLIIAQATLLASSIAAVATGGAALGELRGRLVAFGFVIVARALIAWLQEVSAQRAAAAVKRDLRQRLLDHVARLGPQWLTHQRAGEMATLATRGLDALDNYFARYLPQLILAALVPAVVVAWILPVDLVAAATLVLTIPLIPIFMALVGRTTEHLNRRQFAVLSRLSHHLLEVIAGLPTLKALGRAHAQAAVVHRLSTRQRRLTLRTLRLAFLSSLVLELLATLSVALVAVGIGLRVVSGSLELYTALVVLILAPEAYLPLRQLGTHYHASAEGVAAAESVFAVLETPLPARGTRRDIPDARRHPLVLDEVTVTYPGRDRPALAPTSLRIEPGEVVALCGPSGCGKSTLLAVVMGFVSATAGRVSLGPLDLRDANPDAWRSQLAYVPQRPALFAGTVASNIALGCPELSTPEHDPEVRRVAHQVGLDDLPAGLSTVVGEDGRGLSAGQRQRVALARALLRGAAVLVLDEPTASLDPKTEADILALLRSLAGQLTILLVAHRPSLAAVADRVIAVAAPAAEPVAA